MVLLECWIYSLGILVCYLEYYVVSVNCEKWFFINGICILLLIVILNGLELVKVFYCLIYLIYIFIYGVVWDLWDFVIVRILCKDGKLFCFVYDVVK